MELPEGETLQQRLRRGQMEIPVFDDTLRHGLSVELQQSPSSA
jgi:hypothetical protein